MVTQNYKNLFINQLYFELILGDEVRKKNKIAVMEFNKCYYNKIRQFCDSMFAILHQENIQKLIIDVRKNSGGDSRVGDEILKRIAKKPFYQTPKLLAKVSPAAIERFNEENTLPGMLYMEVPESMYFKPLEKENGLFEGEIILLTSNQTFSSGAAFANAFKEADSGMVIGEETGGMNVSFGDMLYHYMPASEIVTTISYKRFWLMNANENDIHGVLPDIQCKADDALDTAFKILKSK